MVYLQSLIGRIILYLYLGLRAPVVLSPRGVKWLRRAMIGEFVLYLLGFLLQLVVTDEWVNLYAVGGSSLFFSMGYAMMWLVLWDLLFWIDRRWLGLVSRLSPSVRRRGLSLLLAVAGGIVPLMLCVGYYNVRYPRLRHEHIVLDRLTEPGVRPERQLRIVHLTDLHIGQGITQSYIDRAVEQVMQQEADLILIGGDYIDHHASYAETSEMIASMGRLRAPMGVYYTLGNHEYRAGVEKKIDWVRRVGARLVRDEVVYPADSLLALVGRDDYVNDTRATLAQLMDSVETSRPVILLEHTPEGLDLLEGETIDLALYGHTHGGQIWPMHLAVWLKYGIVSGWAQYGETKVFVNSGLGAAGGPYRVLSRSEIFVLDLYW